MALTGNLLAALPDAKETELFETLCAVDGVRIERIVSRDTTPAGNGMIRPGMNGSCWRGRHCCWLMANRNRTGCCRGSGCCCGWLSSPVE